MFCFTLSNWNITLGKYKPMQRSKTNFSDSFKKSLWHKDSDIPYPEADSNQSLAEQFSELFIGKIETIRAKFDEIDILPLEPEIPCEHTFSSFAPLSEEAVKKLIIKSPSKSSALDPIPTHLMEKCIEVLLPIVKELLTYP